MARVELPETVTDRRGGALSGASVQVNVRGGGAATVYADATGGTTVANPIQTTLSGRIEGWVDEGSYDLVVSAGSSGHTFAPYTQRLEAVSGASLGSGDSTQVIVAAPTGVAATDTAAIQAALTTGKRVVLQQGTYVVSAKLVATSWVEGQGIGVTTIKRTTAARIIEWAGSAGADVNLTANATAGALTLAFNTAGIVAGDYLNLRSDEATGAPSASKYGEIVQVHSVDSGTQVTLKAPIADSYTTADVARVAKLTLRAGAGLRGVTLAQDAALSTDNNIGFASFVYCLAPQAVDVECLRAENYGIEFDACVDWNATRPVLRDGIYDPSSNYFSYGVLARGPSQGGSVVDAVGRNAAVFDGGGNARGIPRWTSVNGRVSGRRSALAGPAFGSHSDCEHFVFDRCRVEAWGGMGFEIKGRDHELLAPKINGCRGTGILVAADSATVYPQRVSIVSPDIRNVVDEGANIGSAIALQGMDHSVSGPSIRDVDAYGIDTTQVSTEPLSGLSVEGGDIRNFGRDSTFYSAINLAAALTGAVVRGTHARDRTGGGTAFKAGSTVNTFDNVRQTNVTNLFNENASVSSTRLEATATWDPASVADGAFASVDVTVTGARAGDVATAAHPAALPAGAFLTAAVTANNTVKVTLVNESGAALDLASGTLRVRLERF